MPEAPASTKPATVHRGKLGVLFVNGLTLMVSAALGALLIEFGLRYARYGGFTVPEFYSDWDLIRPHPSRGWALVPNSDAFARTKEFHIHVRINSQGLRDTEHRYAKPPHTKRIVILGDSYMQAQQVELEESLPYLLEEPGVEVINLGVNAYGPPQQLLMLREEGFRYEPDLILLAFYAGNDYLNCHIELMKRYHGPESRTTVGRPYVDLSKEKLTIIPGGYERAVESHDALDARIQARRTGKRFWQRLALYEVFDEQRRTGKRGIAEDPRDMNVIYGELLDHGATTYPSPDGLSRDDRVRYFDEAGEAIQWSIRAIHAECVARGIPFVVVNIPIKPQIHQEDREALLAAYPGLVFNLTKPNRHLAALCAEAGIPLCDLADVFLTAAAEGQRLFFARDTHWNTTGHSVAARETRDFLADRGLIFNQSSSN
jgi:hypothetical protein